MTTERAEHLSMAQHPDIMALRERYERAFETPLAWTVEGLIFMGALYAAISPWIVGFHDVSARLSISNLVVGLVLAAMTIGFAASDAHMHGLTWVTPLMGVWLIITPWIVRGTDLGAGLILSNVITGGCIVLLGAAMTAVSVGQSRR